MMSSSCLFSLLCLSLLYSIRPKCVMFCAQRKDEKELEKDEEENHKEEEKSTRSTDDEYTGVCYLIYLSFVQCQKSQNPLRR